MKKNNPVFSTLSEAAAGVKDFFKKNAEDHRREEILLKKEDDIIRAAAALNEAGVRDERIVELLCKYWKIRPDDARTLMVRGKRHHFS